MMDAKTRDRCLKEVKLLQTLEPHPCIIQYLDSFITDNELYIVFEFAEHGDLRRLLRRALECNATLQEPQIWRYFTQVRRQDGGDFIFRVPGLSKPQVWRYLTRVISLALAARGSAMAPGRGHARCLGAPFPAHTCGRRPLP
eukprot:scaffold988_cov105-Isochrysis_galbana.AAC.3